MNELTPIELLVFSLSTIGLSLIIISSTLFKPLRDFIEKEYAGNKNRFWWFLYSITKCSLCWGVWGGIVNYVIIYFKLYFLLYAFASSFLCYLAATYIEKLKKY